MLRLVERVLGEGELHRDGRVLLRAGYELALYQQIFESLRPQAPTPDLVSPVYPSRRG